MNEYGNLILLGLALVVVSVLWFLTCLASRLRAVPVRFEGLDGYFGRRSKHLIQTRL